MSGDADLAGVGELFADRTRSRILLSLLGGRELAAGLVDEVAHLGDVVLLAAQRLDGQLSVDDDAVAHQTTQPGLADLRRAAERGAKVVVLGE